LSGAISGFALFDGSNNIIIKNTLDNITIDADNIYGLNTNRVKVDSSIITGLDWGAVAYLSHSKYGRCINESCEEIAVNNSGVNSTGKIPVSYTGRSGNAVSGSATFNMCGKYTYDGRGVTDDGTTGNCIIDNSSYSSNNIKLGGAASTTGNVYGVYDLAGGSMERVMSALSNSSTVGASYTYFPNGTSTNNYFSYTNETKKYLTPYAYGSTGTDQSGFNRARLGDATAEVRLATSAWNGNFNTVLNQSNSWNIRGGSYRYATSLDIGIFFSAGTTGAMGGDTTSRSKLVIMK